ncbi:MAG: hypothetical protein LQ348_007753, partial [Seirophora lacunosa]
MASPALSQASTAFESDAPQVQDPSRGRKDAATSQDLLLFMIAFRILNALSIRTFFQPDEYFQSLEPAWQIAFGPDSGAWITWEWKNQLRSAIHPALFAGVYWSCARILELFRMSPWAYEELLIAAPKVTQAVIAALGDYYTWKLAERIYGRGSNEAWAAWPWHWSIEATGDEEVDQYGLRQIPGTDLAEELAKCVPEEAQRINGSRSMAYRLCRCLLLAATACVLRPTNVLIWICLSCFTLWKSSASGRLLKLPWTNGNLWINVTAIAHGPATRRERLVLVFEAAICGLIVLATSAVVDRLYYQQWVFPPFRFLYFNLARSLSVHYGRNDWHYYLSQGYPLLLTTFFPFAIIGICQSLFPRDTPPSQPPLTTTIKHQLATTSLLIPFALSFISHKEVRFIYPLLPPLHILSAAPFAAYFLPLLSPTRRQQKTTKRVALTLILSLNLFLAIFTTQLHQTAPLTVLSYLRSRASGSHTTSVAFLTPCHSTPWRSHLLHSPNLKAWALTCEPPLHLPPSQHPTYLDEADQFYQSPSHWLSLHLGRPPKNPSEQQARLVALEAATGVAWNGVAYSVDEKGRKREKKKAWTGYLVFFEQLEEEVGVVLKGSGYG